VTVPQHVVYRPFVSETVLLNLQTGLYHGINPIGGRMLEVLEHAEDVRAGAAVLAEEFGVPQERVEQDMVEFCLGLLERELIELAASAKTAPGQQSA
jgi:coenzyme PQQ synthesis protein D (PqqD)